MKKSIQTISFTVLSALLGGCAGYNTTMFTTKSNAGLDLDLKPPTAEISIARKEAVIEPGFESGKTPPVLASFHPRVGFGAGFKNYFVGVDQTFAGGDAAKTMAVLYDSPTPVGGDSGISDSTLVLSKAVNGSGGFFSSLFTPAKPGEIRPFIFGTDTMLGLKVAWSGAGGQMPDTVKAGFNRKEFAWAPISMTEDNKSVKMPSFLATIESDIGGGSDTNIASITNGITQNGEIDSLQYFATGDAASYMARQKAVRDAMLKRLDPTYGAKPNLHNPFILRNMLFAMSSTFRSLAASDGVAGGYADRLDNLHGINIPTSFGSANPALKYYQFTPAMVGGAAALVAVSTTQTVPGLKAGAPISTKFINEYISLLQQSMDNIQLAQNQVAGGAAMQISTDGGAPVALTATDAMELQKQSDLQNEQLIQITQQVSANQDVLAAYDYFIRLTKQ